jgi:hypothetical protein
MDQPAPTATDVIAAVNVEFRADIGGAPGPLIRSGTLGPQDVSFIRYNQEPAIQAWLVPDEPFVTPTNPVYNNHSNFYQINIDDLPDFLEFEQVENEIYWVAINVVTTPQFEMGWKTTLDSTVWEHPAAPDQSGDGDSMFAYNPAGAWHPLEGPDKLVVDLAFVITPEPSGMGLLAFGGLFALARRRRRA